MPVGLCHTGMAAGLIRKVVISATVAVRIAAASAGGAQRLLRPMIEHPVPISGELLSAVINCRCQAHLLDGGF